MKKINLKKFIFVAILTYFVARGIEFTFTILPYIGPDERYHIDLSTLFSKRTWMVPASDLGKVGFILPPQYTPYLFHFIMGKILNLNVFDLPIYQFLRLANLFFSTLTVVFTYKLTKLVTKNQTVSLFIIAFLTNIPNFSFISASVTYDNLANLAAVGSLYYVFKYFKDFKLNDLFLMFICLLAGLLTKRTFVPFTAICVSILFFEGLRNTNKIKNSLKNKFSPLLVLLFTLLTLLTANLYVGNLLKFGHLEPICSQVMSEERCSTTKRVERFKTENISPKETRASISKYTLYWYLRTTASVLHHGGHKYMWLPGQIVIIDLVFLSSIAALTVFRFLSMQRYEKHFVFLIFTYLSLLVFHLYQNYYLPTGLPDGDINGRYMFLVIAPIIILFVNTIYFFAERYKYHILTFVLITLILSDYVYFKENLTFEWTTKWYDYYNSLEVKPESPLLYLDSSTHTGEPYGWKRGQ